MYQNKILSGLRMQNWNHQRTKKTRAKYFPKLKAEKNLLKTTKKGKDKL